MRTTKHTTRDESPCKAVRKFQKRNNERGNVLFIILIAIALFGALSYTIANMMRSGSPQAVSKEQSKIYAAEIIDYGNVIRQATQNMLINGCDKEEISFTQNSGDAYEHSPAASTKCKLFETKGGAVNFDPITPDINDGSFYIFTGAHAAENIGSTCTNAACADLLMVLENLKKPVCLAINNRLDISNPGFDAPNDAGGVLTPFNGTFTYGNVLFDEDAALDGRTAGCFRDTPGNTYSYFRVLMAR